MQESSAAYGVMTRWHLWRVTLQEQRLRKEAQEAAEASRQWGQEAQRLDAMAAEAAFRVAFLTTELDRRR